MDSKEETHPPAWSLLACGMLSRYGTVQYGMVPHRPQCGAKIEILNGFRSLRDTKFDILELNLSDSHVGTG